MAPSHAIDAVPPASKPAEPVRISGDKEIAPDERDKHSLEISGERAIQTAYKLCLDEAGVPASVATLLSSGLPGYDAKIRAALLTWRYEPYLVNGVAQPICTTVTFVYDQVGSAGDGGVAREDHLMPSRHVALFRGRELFGPENVRVPIEHPVQAAVPLLTKGGHEPKETDALVFDLAPVGSPYEIALVANPADVATVVRQPVRLASDARGAGGAVSASVPGFRLQRGAPVELLARTQQWVQIRFQEAGLVTSGWVLAAAIGTSYLPEKTASFTPVELVELPIGTSLLDRPGGAALEGKLSAEGPGARIRAMVLQRREGHALVRIGRSPWWVLGWVPEAVLRQRDDARGSPAPSSPVHPVPDESGASSGGARIQIARGAPLLHRPRGITLGRVLEDHQARAQEVQDGHNRIAIRTDLGVIHVWVPVTP